MVNIGIFSVKSNKSILHLIKAAQKHPDVGQVELFFPQDITVEIDEDIKITCSNIDLRDFDILLPRGLNQENTPPYYFEILQFLQDELGYLIINPVAVLRRANSKCQTSVFLQNAGIETPPTMIAQNFEQITHFAAKFSEVVAKPLYRSKGVDLVRFSSDAIPTAKIQALLDKYKVILIQKFVQNAGFDIRTFVLDGKVIATYARQAPQGGWITNVSNGGKAIPYQLNPDLERISLQAATVLGLEYGGLDLFEIEGGYTIIEANGSPDLKDILQIEDVDLSGQLIDYVVKQYKDKM